MKQTFLRRLLPVTFAIMAILAAAIPAEAAVKVKAAVPSGTVTTDSARAVDRIRTNATTAIENARKAVGTARTELSKVNPDSISETVVFEIDNDECSEENIADGDTSDTVAALSNFCDDDDDDCLASKIFNAALIIPIFGIIFGVTVPFGALVLIIYFICRSTVERRRLRYDAIARASEAGHPLPPEFYVNEKGGGTHRLQSGIVWIGWGLAIAVFGLAVDAEGFIAVGIVPLFVGLSRVAVYFVTNRKKESSTSAADEDSDAQ